MATKRRCSKVLLVDRQARVLLFAGVDRTKPAMSPWWFPVGGELEPTETPQDAAIRETREETGLAIADPGPIVFTRQLTWNFEGTPYDQEESYFLVRTETFEPTSERWTDMELETIRGHRWWSIPELRSTNEDVFPEGLADQLERLLADPPADPPGDPDAGRAAIPSVGSGPRTSSVAPSGLGRLRVGVVGGGVIGMSVAWRLAQLGARVVVVDAGHIGGGASSATYAWVNANDKAPFAYHALNVSGMADHTATARELDGNWFHEDGHVRWSRSEGGRRRLAAAVDRLRSWGYPVLELTIDEFRRVEPAVDVPRDVESVAYFPTEGWLDVAAYLAGLRQAAEGLGVEIRDRFKVSTIAAERDGVTAIIDDVGTRVDVDFVVICAGAQTPQVTALVGTPVPMANTVGLVATATAPVSPFRTVVTSGFVNARPDGPGRFCLQAPALDEALADGRDVVARDRTASELLSRAAQVVPALASGQIIDARVGVRPIPADGLPMVGLLPGASNAYLVVAHSGVTLAPALGRLVAREVVHGDCEDLLRAFRPTAQRMEGPARSHAAPLT